MIEVLDPGHKYRITNLEADGTQTWRFIKRSSKMIRHDREYAGSNTQDVIRMLIDRTEYLNDVGPSEESQNAITWLRMALYEYEARAWRRKKQKLNKMQRAQAEVADLNVHRDAYKDIPFTVDGMDGVALEDLPVGRDGHIKLPRRKRAG